MQSVKLFGLHHLLESKRKFVGRPTTRCRGSGQFNSHQYVAQCYMCKHHGFSGPEFAGYLWGVLRKCSPFPCPVTTYLLPTFHHLLPNKIQVCTGWMTNVHGVDELQVRYH